MSKLKKVLSVEEKERNRKIVNICIFSLLTLVLASAVALVVLLNLSVKNPNAVILSEKNGQISFLSSHGNEGDDFVFRFKNGRDEIIDIKTTSNQVYMNNLLLNGIEIGQKYMVSVSVAGDVKSASSFFSDEIEWLAKDFLPSPKISASGTMITIGEVENADYYEIYAGDKMVKVEDLTFDISTLTGGVLQVYVQAFSNSNKFLPSASSNIVCVESVFEYEKINLLKFDKNEHKIKFESRYVFEKIKVSFGNSEEIYVVFVDETIEKDNYFELIYDISLIYDDENSINVLPLTENEYFKYNHSKSKLSI